MSFFYIRVLKLLSSLKMESMALTTVERPFTHIWIIFRLHICYHGTHVWSRTGFRILRLGAYWEYGYCSQFRQLPCYTDVS